MPDGESGALDSFGSKASTTSDEPEYTIDFEIKSLKLNPDGKGSGYLSFYGNVDQMNDVMLPTAFLKSLEEKTSYPLLYFHDPKPLPVGTFEAKTDKNGLRIDFQIADTTFGRDASKLIAMGALRGLSPGYNVQKKSYSGGVRNLGQVQLVEGSITPFPANTNAMIDQFKSLYTPEERKSCSLFGGCKEAKSMEEQDDKTYHDEWFELETADENMPDEGKASYLDRGQLVKDLAGMSDFDVNAQRRRLTQWAARNAILQGFTADDMQYYYNAVIDELCKRKKAAGGTCSRADYTALTWSGSNTGQAAQGGSEQPPDETKHTAGAVAAARAAMQSAVKKKKGGKSMPGAEETKSGAIFRGDNLKSLKVIQAEVNKMIAQMESDQKASGKSTDGAEENKEDGVSFEEMKSYFERISTSS
jgi:HK97 family phage prohead protease